MERKCNCPTQIFGGDTHPKSCSIHAPTKQSEEQLILQKQHVPKDRNALDLEGQVAVKQSEDGLETRGLTENHEAMAIVDQMKKAYKEVNSNEEWEKRLDSICDLHHRDCTCSYDNDRKIQTEEDPHCNRTKVYNFFRSLLLSQKEEIGRMIEGMKRAIPKCSSDCPFCGRGLFRKCNAFAEDKEYNQACTEIASRIKGK